MNPIVYVDGALADAIGANELRRLAKLLATLSKEPVDVLTHGPSKYHGDKRITEEPCGERHIAIERADLELLRDGVAILSPDDGRERADVLEAILDELLYEPGAGTSWTLTVEERDQ
jgi:hypothetical protein